MQKNKLLYKGKAKSAYLTDDTTQLILEFRDDASAFDGTKLAQLAGKGAINNQFNCFIMEKLQQAGIDTHFIRKHSDTEAIVKRLDMIPVECVVRNLAAGSISRRLGIAEGQELSPAIFEFFLKNDELHDPMINESHIETFAWATSDEVTEMKRITHQVNQVLTPMFAAADMILVDYKLEFGRFQGNIILGDEFTPDGCRIWDAATKEKLDKDRFRRDLGDVIESYHIAAKRLGVI